jgi:TonB family protein
MPLTPLAPAMRAGVTGRRWSVAASALLHVLVIALVIGIAARPPPPGLSGSPSYDLVFEGSGPTAPNQSHTPALPPMQPADIPVPDDAPLGAPAPAAMSPPAPDAASSAQPQAANTAPSPLSAPAPTPSAQTRPPPASHPATATTPAPAPGQAALAPPRLAFAPPAERAIVPEPAPVEMLPTPAPPAVRLEEPPAPAEPEQQAAPIAPQRLPPLPPAPPRPRPTPRAAPGTLSNPMDLSFGPAAPRPAARGSVASRAIDLSPPPERQGPARSDPYAAIRAANASADWNRGLLQFWLRHRYYPRQAVEDAEQGTVTIQLTVNRSGKVEDVEVVSRSGSQWLDMAAVGTFRGAQLPPFTNEMRQDRLTFPIPITYYLIR